MTNALRTLTVVGLTAALCLFAGCNKRDNMPPASPADQTASAPMGGASAP
ncbi:MAG: hypothetical protein JSR59_04545 [Proteobacteria bacterium]|nr:hypothetical protein [Pseudomonadota bacterium]